VLLAASAPLALGGLGACFAIGEGLPPPLDKFYYPTGLLVSPGRSALYVINSDFDLQYNGGTVQALDLAALREGQINKLRTALNTEGTGAVQACAALGLAPNDNPTLYPGPCKPITLGPLVAKSTVIGAFASGGVLALRPCKDGRGARLFVPVRGDPSVTYFDIVDDRQESAGCPKPTSYTPPCADAVCLSCGADPDSSRCSGDHLIGRDPGQSQRNLTLPVEPFGIAVDDLGESLVVAHQTQALASLVVNRWGSDAQNKDRRPTLEHYVGNLPAGPTDVVGLPIPKLILERWALEDPAARSIDYTPAFGLSFRAAPEFDLIRYESDEGSSAARPFITRAAAARIGITASSTDSRGVAVDASERQACESGCVEGAEREACLRTCVEKHPLRVFMGNRAPAALVTGEIATVFTEKGLPGGGTQVTGAFEVPSFQDAVPLAFGTSRVAIGRVIDQEGKPSLRVFAVTFDSRFVFSYDPQARRVDAIIRTGRGPQAIAFDTGEEDDGNGNKRMYSTMFVAHFTDSWVGVVDLDMRNPATFGSMFLSVGEPQPPKESQ
jgi:hypothetical protein